MGHHSWWAKRPRLIPEYILKARLLDSFSTYLSHRRMRP
jgi:hypothetical protein